MSDEELQDKLATLQSRLWSAHMFGMGLEVRDQLTHYCELIEAEVQSRFALDMQKAWDSQFPDVIETEPDLSTEKKVTKKPGKTKPGDAEAEVERPKVTPKFNKVYRK